MGILFLKSLLACTLVTSCYRRLEVAFGVADRKTEARVFGVIVQVLDANGIYRNHEAFLKGLFKSQSNRLSDAINISMTLERTNFAFFLVSWLFLGGF